MAEEQPILRNDESDGLPSVPSHSPLPPPPEVHYTRPTLGRAAPHGTGEPERPSTGPGRPSGDQLGDGLRGYAVTLTAALTLAITLAAFIGLGLWLDRHFNHSGTPWFTIAGLLLGVVGGLGNMIRLLALPGDRGNSGNDTGKN